MLREARNVRQIRGDGKRRWFSDDYFDLIVWYNDSGNLTGFQLCYDKSGEERAITWRGGPSCTFERIDEGEIPGHSNMTPVLVADDSFPPKEVAEQFLKESAGIEPELARLVYDTLRRHRSRVA